MNGINRRRFLAYASGMGASLAAPALAQSQPRVVVIGGGVGGTTMAKYLRRDSHGSIKVTLVEPNRLYMTPFTSNKVLGGLAEAGQLVKSYEALSKQHGVNVVHDRVTRIDRSARMVRLSNGGMLPYDRLVLSPGIDFRYDQIAGLNEADSSRVPHGWGGQEQFDLLRQQFDAVPDGGTIVIIPPPNPTRCQPAPYERACMMAHRLKTTGRSKTRIIILDTKDHFTMQPIFAEAWDRYYQGMIEWQDPAIHGGIKRIDPKTLTVKTDLETHKASLINYIPPQVAGKIASIAQLVDSSGFCPVDAETLRSRFDANIHVIGDACIAGDLPKSGFAANNEAKITAMQISADLTGSRRFPVRFTNNCWSQLAPDDAVKNGGRYEPRNGKITALDTFVSALDEPRELRQKQAEEAIGWYRGMGIDIFGS